MTRRKTVLFGIVGCVVLLLVLFSLEMINLKVQPKESPVVGDYHSLPQDTSKEDPLLYLEEDFTVKEGFHSNLPIVLLDLDSLPADYKVFKVGAEIIDESVEPWSTGTMRIIGIDSTEQQDNCLSDAPNYESRIRIKKRGHTSFVFDKSQYYVKAVLPDGSDNTAEILGMGEGHNWILNGSMADKSMIRNYLAFRISSEASGSAMAPDSRFCEVLFRQEDGSYRYMGTFLLMENVSRGENRVNIDSFKKKNIYTSYIVRRDRYTDYDVMLETYGRQNGYTDTWIGLKYPSKARITPYALDYIEKDFSHIEQILYSENTSSFLSYPDYIDTDSFVDYFLLNEFFGNYDAGLHSTYMYKKSGGKLMIGPVWDFDQAMNNYFAEEMNEQHIAFQTQTFFEQLVRDRKFVSKLKDRYREMREGALSNEHIFAVINEASDYLRSARVREYYRWAANYESSELNGGHNYVLEDYEQDSLTVSRFNTDYEQELRVLRIYLVNHADNIQPQLSNLLKEASLDSSVGSANWLYFIAFLILMFGIALVSKRID